MSDYKKQVGVVRADRILPSEAKRDWLASGDSLSGFAQDVLKICPKAFKDLLLTTGMTSTEVEKISKKNSANKRSKARAKEGKCLSCSIILNQPNCPDSAVAKISKSGAICQFCHKQYGEQ